MICICYEDKENLDIASVMIDVKVPYILKDYVSSGLITQFLKYYIYTK